MPLLRPSTLRPTSIPSLTAFRKMSTNPDFTKNLPAREPSAEENGIIQDILALYQCRPSEKAYSHYSADAQFRDPVSIAKGKSQIQAQFNGMPKIFSESETKGIPSSLPFLSLFRSWVTCRMPSPFKSGNRKIRYPTRSNATI